MGSYLSTKQKRNKNTYARTSHPAISCAKIQIWELSKFKCHLDMKTWFLLLLEYFWKNYKTCIYRHFICCCYTSQFWLPKAYFFCLLQIFNCRLTVKGPWFTQKTSKVRHTERKTVCWSMFYLSSLHYNTFKSTHLKLYCSVVNGISGSSLFLFTIDSPKTSFYFIITYTPIFF